MKKPTAPFANYNIRPGDSVVWLGPDKFYHEAIMIDIVNKDEFRIEIGGDDGWRTVAHGAHLSVTQFSNE